MIAQTPALAFELLPEHFCIVLYKAARPAQEGEWDRYLDLVRSTLHYGERLRFFNYNEDGELSRVHQTRLSEITRGHMHRVAVVSPSPVLRFVVSMFLLFNRNIRFFAPTQLAEAYAHLRFDAATRSAVESSLARLRTQTTESPEPAPHSSLRS